MQRDIFITYTYRPFTGFFSACDENKKGRPKPPYLTHRIAIPGLRIVATAGQLCFFQITGI